MVAGDEGGEAGGDGVAAAEGRRRAEEGRRLVVGAPVRRAGWWIHGGCRAGGAWPGEGGE